jgi:uncharacterized membrane protein
MKKYIAKSRFLLFGIVALFTPVVSFAQRSIFSIGSGSRYGSGYSGGGSTVTDIIFFMINLINQAVVLVVGLALLFFFWGVAMFVLNSDDVEKRAQGKSHIMWGIIALFVMLFVWQIVNILANTFF